MSEPFVGEIRAFGFTFAPAGWAFCNGQLLPISQFTPLFAIIGTTYGGNGVSTFALPNLQGCSPMHWGTGPGGFITVIGEPQGVSSVTLLSTQIPVHTHTMSAASVPQGASAERSAGPMTNSYLAEATAGLVYQPPPASPNTPFNGMAVSSAGNSLPHDNMQPFLTLNFCIALEGIFPSRN
jgi:microcystin-dependent protein